MVVGGLNDNRADRDDLHAARHAPSTRDRRQAVSRLLSRYRAQIYVWCRRYVRDPETAQEMTQDILLRAYKGMPRLAPDTRFDAWIFIVTRNTCLNHLRRPRLLADENLEPDALQGREPGPDQRLEEREDETALLQLMDECLAQDERQALVLRCFECMPVEMITQVLGLEMASGARALLQRARRKLKAALAARNEETRR